MTAVERLITLEQKKEWQAALSGVPHGFAHTWENCRAVRLASGLPTFLYVYEEDGTRVVCALSERQFGGFSDIVTPRGFSGFSSNGTIRNFRKRWLDFVRRRGYVCGFISLNPLFENPVHYGPSHDLNVLHFLDLTRGAAALLETADRSRRRLVREWQRSGLSYMTDRAVLTDFLVANHGRFMMRAGASADSLFSEETLRAICVAPQVAMVGADSEGEIEAVYVFAHTPWAADCLFNISTPAGKAFTTALLWWGVEHYAERGIPSLNMGAGVQPDDNIAAAKQKFRPEQRMLRCLKEIYRPDTYVDLCRAAGTEPNSISEYFPSYRSQSSKN